MTASRTSQGTIVTHSCHITEPTCGLVELTRAEILNVSNLVRTNHPNATEVALATRTFNCHGFALAESHGTFYFPELFFEHDHFEVSFDQPAVGDVVAYQNGVLVMHTALVIRVSDDRIVRLRSKWGEEGPTVEHDLDDVPEVYGCPVKLLRRNPGLSPFVSLTEEIAMTADEPTGEPAADAIRKFSDPAVNVQVRLASTPDAAGLIIESLPGVQELLDLGPEAAGRAALDLLNKEATRQNDVLTRIALYILKKTSNEEAAPQLASDLREHKFAGMTLHLASDALLSATKSEPATGDSVAAAMEVAEKLKPI